MTNTIINNINADIISKTERTRSKPSASLTLISRCGITAIALPQMTWLHFLAVRSAAD